MPLRRRDRNRADREKLEQPDGSTTFGRLGGQQIPIRIILGTLELQDAANSVLVFSVIQGKWSPVLPRFLISVVFNWDSKCPIYWHDSFIDDRAAYGREAPMRECVLGL